MLPISNRDPCLRAQAEAALGRATGAPLSAGNKVDLLIDAPQHYACWQEAITGAKHSIRLENYIFANDSVGQDFLGLLCERAKAGLRVRLIIDWLGTQNLKGRSFWKAFLNAGGEVRFFNPFHFNEPFGWVSRDHRKLLVVDGQWASVSGVCIASQWLGQPQRGIAPWRDTGVRISGPAVHGLVQAFESTWNSLGASEPIQDPELTEQGTVALRVIASTPASASMFRLDHLVATLAEQRLWIADAYFVAMPSYVQALSAAARDGVDVRLLIPGSSDLRAVAAIGRLGYRSLLEAGVRVFEWNGSMMHAKTAVADDRWSRIGSSNLNISSWLANLEIDVAIEDSGFAECMAAQYLTDLGNATELLLAGRRARPLPGVALPKRPRQRGSSGRTAAGALRLANTVGATLLPQRNMGHSERGLLTNTALILLALGVLGLFKPAWLAWPLSAVMIWIGLSLAWKRLRKP